MKPRQLILILGFIIPLLGIFGFATYVDYFKTPIPEKTTNEKHYEIEQKTKPPEQTIQKTWTDGNTTINYEVGIENGVEETPPPDIVEVIGKSITDEDKEKYLQEYYNSTFYKIRQQFNKDIKLHNPAYIKSYIDQAFTCETYQDLAYKYKMDMLFDDDGKFIDAENYVYQKAFNECINPKHQEEIEKVNKELEEVNATSIEEVNVND